MESDWPVLDRPPALDGSLRSRGQNLFSLGLVHLPPLKQEGKSVGLTMGKIGFIKGRWGHHFQEKEAFILGRKNITMCTCTK